MCFVRCPNTPIDFPRETRREQAEIGRSDRAGGGRSSDQSGKFLVGHSSSLLKVAPEGKNKYCVQASFVPSTVSSRRSLTRDEFLDEMPLRRTDSIAILKLVARVTLGQVEVSISELVRHVVGRYRIKGPRLPW